MVSKVKTTVSLRRNITEQIRISKRRARSMKDTSLLGIYPSVLQHIVRVATQQFGREHAADSKILQEIFRADHVTVFKIRRVFIPLPI